MYTELVDFMFGYDVENIANNYKIISWNCQQIYVRKVKQLYKKNIDEKCTFSSLCVRY